VKKKQVHKSKKPQTLATPCVYSDLENLDNPMDNKESGVTMEAIGKKPVKKTKEGMKKKNKETVSQLQDKIRAIRKEVPKLEVGLRVQLISFDNDVR